MIIFLRNKIIQNIDINPPFDLLLNLTTGEATTGYVIKKLLLGPQFLRKIQV